MGITNPFGQAKAAIRSQLRFVTGPVRRRLAPALKVLDDIPRAIMKAVNGIVAGAVRLVRRAITFARKQIELTMIKVEGWVKRAINAASSWVQQAIIRASVWVQAAINSMKLAITRAVDRIGSLIASVVRAVGVGITRAISIASNLVNRAVNIIKVLVQRSIDAATRLINSAVNLVKSAVTRSISFSLTAVKSAVSLAESGITRALKAVGAIGNAILQFVKGLVGVLENVIGYILSRIANAVVAIAGFIAALSQIGTDGIVDIIVGISDTLNTAAKRMQT